MLASEIVCHVTQYHQMIDGGIFAPDDRLEELTNWALLMGGMKFKFAIDSIS